jgi:hypothetical protein
MNRRLKKITEWKEMKINKI